MLRLRHRIARALLRLALQLDPDLRPTGGGIEELRQLLGR